MTLIPLDIPPGLYANGTDLDASNRWLDCNLVRWRDGSLRPVGGWRSRVSGVSTDPARGSISWQDNSADRWMAFGSASELVAVASAGAVYDITPSGLSDGLVDAAQNPGYGGGVYGAAAYGTVRPATGTYSECTTWALDTWGEYLVAVSSFDGVLYEWDLDTGGEAAPIANAPTGNLSMIVTQDRFLMALGAGGDPRKVQWCDREDNTLWTPDATNEAGDITLQTDGQIMAGIRARGQTLILTDTDAHAATYQGPPFVYGFERVGTSCGLFARKAISVNDGGVFWMGARGFFHYDGATVTELKCDVYDKVFLDISRSQSSKVWAMSVGQQGEVWWFYVSGAGLEVDRYVAFDYKEGHWHAGELSRTTGFDRGVFAYPVMADVSGDVHDHEIAENYDGAEVFAESGPISLGTGEHVMKVTGMYPDELTQGDVTATFKTRFHPNDVEREYGPYSMSNPTSMRFTGRQIRMRVSGNALTRWRVGVNRINAVPGGKR